MLFLPKRDGERAFEARLAKAAIDARRSENLLPVGERISKFEGLSGLSFKLLMLFRPELKSIVLIEND